MFYVELHTSRGWVRLLKTISGVLDGAVRELSRVERIGVPETELRIVRVTDGSAVEVRL